MEPKDQHDVERMDHESPAAPGSTQTQSAPVDQTAPDAPRADPEDGPKDASPVEEASK